jgi:hypothetical protein
MNLRIPPAMVVGDKVLSETTMPPGDGSRPAATDAEGLGKENMMASYDLIRIYTSSKSHPCSPGWDFWYLKVLCTSDFM